MQPPFDGSVEKIDNIGFQPWQDYLRFGIAKSAIEFKHARPLFRKHHAGEKQSSKVKAFGLDSQKQGFQNLFLDLIEAGAIQVRRGAAGAHSTGVWPSVTIVNLLVILCRREQQIGVAVYQGV